eukprot:Nitzschia sp. Nitz4//scaffold81_size91200//63065//63136//NITZ4_004993-RA/size91200-exonerate_protein2genome-gene-0.24-mRNA-1//1//CDS//3329558731//371//frame0
MRMSSSYRFQFWPKTPIYIKGWM